MENYNNLTGSRLVNSLGIAACHLVELPDSREDCSQDNTTCLQCPVLGRFLTGDGFDDYASLSHILCIFLTATVVIMGVLGTVANLLIILILTRQNSGRAFDTFLVGLAGFDLLCSVSSVCSATSAMFYFQNWSRNAATAITFCGGLLAALFARSGSSFMTVMITFERYLVVAFPISCGSWFTVTRTRMLAVSVVIWALITGTPRFTSVRVEENIRWRSVESVKDTSYLILSTPWEKFWYYDLYGFFDQIDFWGPLPLLLVFNGLVYYHVRQFEMRRKELNMKHKKDIRSAKMFLPVVLILFICNILPIVHYCFIFHGLVYRELYYGMLISFTVNSAVNLPIYYMKGSSFRKETRTLLSSYFSSFNFSRGGDESNTGDKGASNTGPSGNNSNSIDVKYS